MGEADAARDAAQNRKRAENDADEDGQADDGVSHKDSALGEMENAAPVGRTGAANGVNRGRCRADGRGRRRGS